MAFFAQSLGQRLKAKEAHREKDAAAWQAREAKAAGRQAALAELSEVREENHRLQEKVHELRCGMKGKSYLLYLLFCLVRLELSLLVVLSPRRNPVPVRD